MAQRFVIVTADSYYGSFGDQAMVVSTVMNLQEKYPGAEFILFNTYNAPEDDIFVSKYGINAQSYFPKEDVFKEFVEVAKGCDAVYVIGADVMDGAYSEKASVDRYKLLDIANALGIKTAIIGFSFFKNPSKNISNIVKYISNHTVLNVRDVDSWNRLKKIGCKNTRLVADAAFLFDEKKHKKSQSALDLYTNLKNIKNKKIIGVCLACSRGTDCKPFIKKIADALQTFNDIYVVIFPHDSRTYDDALYYDAELGQIMGDELLSRGIECINAVGYLKDETDVKYILNLVDFVISCRMHLAIASLSKGIPVISFGYNDKFDGLYKLYNLNKCMLLDRGCDKGEIVNAIEYVMQQNLRKNILEKNKDVLQKAKKNFAGFVFNPLLGRRKNWVDNYKYVEAGVGPYYNFISLGRDCFSRTLLTWWNMKHTKAEGELSMPFDLAMHHIKAVTAFLKNDFADFFEALRFDEQTQNWHNDKYGNIYNHDQTCVELEDFKSRYLARIENFRQAVSDKDNLFFVYHDVLWEKLKKKHIKRLAKALSGIRKKNFRLIVITPRFKRIRAKNVSVIYAKEPYIDYVWWNEEHKTILANEYEANIIKKMKKICKKYMCLWRIEKKVRDILHIKK